MSELSAEVTALAQEPADEFSDDTLDQLSVLDGLTDTQRVIVRFKMGGQSQAAAAMFLNVSPAYVSQQMKKIRSYFEVRGMNVNQDVLIGSTRSLYEEVEYKSWEVFHTDDNKRLPALDLIMTAREKQVKLLMDLGIMRRAAVEHTHDAGVSPLIEKMTQEQKDDLVRTMIESQFSPGIEPTPPDDDDYPLEPEVVGYDESN